MAKELVDNFDPSSIRSIFDTNNQKHAEDNYFLESGDKIRFFFEVGAFDKKGNLTNSIELLINKGKLLAPEKELSHEIIQVEKVTSITKILENFKIDKSKHFILENQQIFDAAGDGIKAGAFGYSEEAPEQQDGKYVGKIEEIVFPSPITLH